MSNINASWFKDAESYAAFMKGEWERLSTPYEEKKDVGSLLKFDMPIINTYQDSVQYFDDKNITKINNHIEEIQCRLGVTPVIENNLSKMERILVDLKFITELLEKDIQRFKSK